MQSLHGYKWIKSALALLLAGALLTACGSPAPETESPAAGGDAPETTDTAETGGEEGEAPGTGWTGEITFFAQDYTPKQPDATNPNPPTMLQVYADAYAEENPGVTISFVEMPGDAVQSEWMRTQAAAKQLPDIVFNLASAVGTTYPKEMFQPIDEYLAKETPYVPGTKWGDTFHPVVLEVTQVGDGQHYTVSADYVETGIYYNAAMFEDAGITNVPTNWEEFLEVCAQLQDAGYAAMAWSMAQDDTYAVDWGSRIFLSNFYADLIEDIDVDGTKGVSQMEQAIAFKNGVVRVDDGRFLAYFDTLKDLTPYMNEGWSSKSDLEQKFMLEEVAMYWTGSWLPKKMADAGVDFAYGSFPFPTPTAETVPGVSSNSVTSGAVGGPSGNFQYCVTSPEANSTMTEEKRDVVMDWLMYITEPGRVSEIVNEVGNFCPTILGSTPAEGMEGLMDNFNADYVNFNGGQAITNSAYDAVFRNLHQYMMGEITMDQAVATLALVFEEEVDIVIEDNPEWDIEPYLN